jgi:hypothetical protein
MTLPNSTPNIHPVKSWRAFDRIRRIHNDQKQATPHRPKTMNLVKHFLLWVRWRNTRMPLLVFVGHKGNSYGIVSWHDHGGDPYVEVGVMKKFKGTDVEREIWEAMTVAAQPRPAYTCVRSDDSFVTSLLHDLKWEGGWYSDGEGCHTQTYIRNDR